MFGVDFSEGEKKLEHRSVVQALSLVSQPAFRCGADHWVTWSLLPPDESWVVPQRAIQDSLIFGDFRHIEFASALKGGQDWTLAIRAKDRRFYLQEGLLPHNEQRKLV
jgi:hypothetical protein